MNDDLTTSHERVTPVDDRSHTSLQEKTLERDGSVGHRLQTSPTVA